jgi:hypothetical protein
MIKRKKKVCKNCNNERYLFGKGLCEACYKITSGKPIPISKVEIKKVSSKESKRQRAYKELRDSYLEKHPLCESCSTSRSSEIHHKKGRIGENLFNHFLAVCHDCHVWIENNPELAKEQGFSISRLGNG